MIKTYRAPFKARLFIAFGILVANSAYGTESSTNIALMPNLGVQASTQSVAISQDNPIAAVASSDSGISVWDLREGRLLRTVRHDGTPESLALSSDGRYLAVSEQGNVFIYEASSGALAHAFKAPKANVSDPPSDGSDRKVWFTYGTHKAIAAWAHKVMSLDLDTGLAQPIANVPIGGSISVISDGSVLFTKINPSFVEITDERNRVRATLPISRATWVTLSSNGTKAFVGDDRELTIWDLKNRRPLRSLDKIQGTNSVVVGDAGSLAYVFREGKILVIDLDNLSTIAELATDVTPQGARAANSSIVAFVGADQETHVVSRATGALRLGVGKEDSAGLAFSGDDNLLVGRGSKRLGVWDLKGGGFFSVSVASIGSSFPSLTPNGQRAAWATSDGSINIAEANSLRKPKLVPGVLLPQELSTDENQCKIALSDPDQGGFVISESNLVRFDYALGADLSSLIYDKRLASCLIMSPNGQFLAIALSGEQIGVFSAASGKLIRSLNIPKLGGPATWLQFSADGEYLFFGVHNGGWGVLDFKSEKLLARIEAGLGKPNGGFRVAAIVGSRQAVIGDYSGSLVFWDSIKNTVNSWRAHNGPVASLASSPDGKRLASAGVDGSIKLWVKNFGSWAEVGQLIAGEGDDWVVLTPDARFAAGDMSSVKAVSWVASDDPLHALPPEIFMRDYYEPRLLPRLLACENAKARGDGDACKKAFKPVRSLAELNRVQPDVRVVGVLRGESADEALVDVEVSGKEDLTQKNGKTKTEAFDLRLFRDGQIVGQWPQPVGGIAGAEAIETWRDESKVPMISGSTKAVHRFAVRLAKRDRGQPVNLTAYAFNEDRIKSETTSNVTYKVPDDVGPVNPRAYLITIGVNAYENPNWMLGFAAKDARDISAALRRIDGYSVVTIPLISEESKGFKVNQATKANIESVLALLAGRDGINRERLKASIGDIANELQKASPDDLVILAFSGHGYTDPHGRFYLLPSDSGTENAITDAILAKFISSDELSQWLRDVDAGEMVMVIDACHSAASIPEGFKPGPMGDRGLGQLAYDKGMQILAATQADDVALESERLGQGLLTYALIDDGLKARKAATDDGKGPITLKALLRYAEKRVPDLYEDIKSGKLRIVGKDPSVDPIFYDRAAQHAQTPALFDFYRQANDPIVQAQ